MRIHPRQSEYGTSFAVAPVSCIQKRHENSGFGMESNYQTRYPMRKTDWSPALGESDFDPRAPDTSKVLPTVKGMRTIPSAHRVLSWIPFHVSGRGCQLGVSALADPGEDRFARLLLFVQLATTGGHCVSHWFLVRVPPCRDHSGPTPLKS